MHDSDKHCCKLCGTPTLPLYGYSMQLPSVVELRAYSEENGKWFDVDLRVCPNCGYIQGEVNHDNN